MGANCILYIEGIFLYDKKVMLASMDDYNRFRYHCGAVLTVTSIFSDDVGSQINISS